MCRKNFGSVIKQLRKDRGLTSAALAKVSLISGDYLEKIESRRSIPPPRMTITNILNSLDLQEDQKDNLLKLAAFERGSFEAEEQLTFEVRQLLNEIRRNAQNMPPAFVQHLRITVRSVAGPLPENYK
jgi:transcriptional regulator with XRE-family HTH domain